MSEDRKSLRDALAKSTPPAKGIQRPADKAAHDAIARESSARYRKLVSDLNRTRDSEIEKVFRGA